MRLLRAWGPALLWAALIFAVSHRSTVALPNVSNADKLSHAAAYAVLGAALAYALHRSGVRRWALWTVALGWLYGASDEFHQSFVPGRSPDVADWVADAVGVLIGTFVYRRWLAWRGPRSAARTSDAHPLAP